MFKKLRQRAALVLSPIQPSLCEFSIEFLEYREKFNMCVVTVLPYSFLSFLIIKHKYIVTLHICFWSEEMIIEDRGD